MQGNESLYPFSKEIKGMKPEELARKQIDEMLTEAGWIVQNRQELNLGAGLG